MMRGGKRPNGGEICARAAFPVTSLKWHKYWPPVGRIDNAYGDRNIMCSCVPMEAYATEDVESATRVAG